MRTRHLTPMFLVCLWLTWSTPAETQHAAPPSTPKRPVTETFFGTKLVDHYRWIEDLTSSEAQGWFKTQNQYTRQVLDAIPGREKLRARIAELDNTGLRVSGLQSFGGRLFYFRQAPGDDNRKLYVREGATERLLLDPVKLTANGIHYSIDYYQASPNGKFVAAGVSPGGSENAVVHVLDADSDRDLGMPIDRAQFGSVAWLPDNRSFFCNRLQKLESGESNTRKYLNSRVYLHRLGEDPARDTPIFGKGISSAVVLREEDIPFLIVPLESKWAFGIVAHGVQNETTVYVTAVKEINGAGTPWRKIADISDDVTGVDVNGDRVYLLTHHGASRYKVVQIDLPNGEIAKATTVIAPADAVVTSITAAADALYVQKLDGGLGRLWRLPFAGGPASEIQLPFGGAIQEMAANPAEPGIYLRLASWTKSSLYYHFDPKSGAITDTKLVSPSPADFSRIESEEVKATAQDGTLVPLSIIHQRGLKLDGSHPALVHGYGSYGITYDPAFDPSSLAWLERGGVIAVAHVRGGGEYGEDWHNGGRNSTKKNTITDFIACAQYLIQHKYTSPAHLAGEGTSAGGITIGGAITERPDLFAAALDNVGMSDDLRAELQVNGPANIPEFGTVKKEDDFRNLLAISAYHRVKDKTPYPAVLLTTGINDPRVDSWQMGKMTARLQSATSSGKPVLLRVDYDAGHGGIGATRSQHTALVTDQYSFLLWQLGDAEFQPAARASVPAR